MELPAAETITLRPSPRFLRIRNELLAQPVHLCAERALLITDFFKQHDNRKEPMVVRKARAFRYLLENKAVRIWPDEQIVGNIGTRRVSAIIQPELAGVFMCEELHRIETRKTTPHPVDRSDRRRLFLKVIPYWLTRNMASRAFRNRFRHLLRYVPEQLNATFYLINEAGGIGHFLPNYERIIRIGIKGYLDEAADPENPLHAAVRIACRAMTRLATRFAKAADTAAATETDPRRAEELRRIAANCRRVPLKPATTFHEALQSLWFAHMGVCLEGLNSAVSFGRIDQYLYPYYQKDIADGRLTREEAFDLLLGFSAKTTEHVFLVSERTAQYHGGYLVAQAATVGGMDRDGNDAVNELTWLFLDVMEHARLRDPNYMARIHPGSPDAYIRRAVEVACKGSGVPGLFSDTAAISAITAHGYPVHEAQDYGIVGCVEPAFPGKSFFSTDAALMNLPLCLILALNEGKRLDSRRRLGAKTPPVKSLISMDAVMDAFEAQVKFMTARLVRDIQVIETGNRMYHPTPFSSMLVDGCLEKGMDVTAGGAKFNSSGIQGVGVADVADSLAAIDHLVFRKKSRSLSEVVAAMTTDFIGAEKLRAALQNGPRFGNDHPLPDGYAARVVRIFHDALARFTSTRGGPYVPGFYSSTCHVGFGNRTEALPSGRKKGEPFAASLGCCNGRDRLGPTALLNSVAAIDSSLSPNGYALNLKLDAATVSGEKGVRVMTALTRGFFRSGGMELQLNVFDADVLEQARKDPAAHPGIVVRVAGYCAYFNDLPDSVKGEIIARTRFRLDG